MQSNKLPVALMDSPAAYRGRLASSTFWVYPVVLLGLAIALSSCSKTDLPPPNTGGNGQNPPTYTSPSPSPTPNENLSNVVRFGINEAGYCSQDSYTNKPCARIQICDPGTNNCATVDDVLIDTGSYGLRIFKDKISNLSIANAAGSLAECVEYGDGARQWGPVRSAKVRLKTGVPDNQLADVTATIPIQVIDGRYPGMQENCTDAERDSIEAGMGGILGIGIFKEDCGPYCETDANNNIYFECNGTSCQSVKVVRANQVQNPIAHLPAPFNNGVAIKIRPVKEGGEPYAFGHMIFGIGPQANNPPGQKTAFKVDPSFGEFTTNFRNRDYHSFIDTGSNALGIPGGIYDECSSQYAGWLCPSTGPQSTSATAYGYDRGTSAEVKFRVNRFDTLFTSGNAVFSESAYSSGANISGYFDWGLPFYLGKDVYHVFENESAPGLGGGPAWAW